MYRFVVSMRYLRTKKVNFFPICGVAVGVMVLTVIMSVMNGFVGEMRDRIRGTLSDLIVSRSDGAFPMDDVLDRIGKIPHVVACSPHLEGLALIRLRNIRRWCIFEGIDPALESKVGKFAEYVGKADEQGKFVYAPIPKEFRVGIPPTDPWPIVVSVGLLNMGGEAMEVADYVQSGERVTIYTLVGVDEHNLKQFTLAGSFKSGMSEYDSQYVYTPLDLAQKLRKAPGMITSVYVKLDDPKYTREVREAIQFELHSEMARSAIQNELNNAEILAAMEKKLPAGVTPADVESARDDAELRQVIEKKLPPDLTVEALLSEMKKRDLRTGLEGAMQRRDAGALMIHLSKIRGRLYCVETWEEKRFVILRAVAVEKGIQAVILFFIIIVAGFMVLAILHMIVVEKTKDIGILKALGGTPGGIMSIFLMNGLTIGVVGSVVGSVCGLLFTWKLNWLEDVIYRGTGWRLFPPDVYYLDKIPWRIHPTGVLICAVAAIAVSFLASVYPAWRAARLDPVEALRYE